MYIYSDSRHQLIGKGVIREYLMGGKGVVTLESPSGVSHTYCYFKPKDSSVFPEDVRFVYALHDGRKLFYIGMIEEDVFRLTHHSRFLPDTEIVRGAKYIEKMMNRDFDTPMKLYHEGVCARCGRKLSSGKSLETGIGPKCRKLL